jgi:dihydropteroate synthase
MLRSSSLTVRARDLVWGKRTYLMGILNITPDSFSGDGLLSGGREASDGISEGQLASILELARSFAAAGADLIDIGGESSRPGSQPISAAEEMERILPVIRALNRELDVIISVDTYKAEVAQAALEAGANVINDIWGLRADPALAGVAARFGAPIILMHNRSSWVHAEIKERLGGRYVGVAYEDLILDIQRELMESVDTARAAGIPDENIILDPGIGFGKTVEQNFELVNRLEEIRKLGFPVLLGPSRKSFIGFTLDSPPDQRLEGTAAAVAIGIARGADIVRVHDVEFMVRLARMADAITRQASPE